MSQWWCPNTTLNRCLKRLWKMNRSKQGQSVSSSLPRKRKEEKLQFKKVPSQKRNYWIVGRNMTLENVHKRVTTPKRFKDAAPPTTDK